MHYNVSVHRNRKNFSSIFHHAIQIKVIIMRNKKYALLWETIMGN